jgi:hypothetical protein
MKKILLSVLTVLLIGASTVNAQCDLGFNNLVITPHANTVPLSNPPRCQYTFDVTFDITTNSGFKYLFFHSWLTADYPNPSIFDCGGNTPATKPGTKTQLGSAIDEAGKSFLDLGFIGLQNAVLPAGTPVDVTSYIANTYPNDPDVTLINTSTSQGLTAYVTRDNVNSSILHFAIQNIMVIVNQPCGAPIVAKTDIWGSNQNANSPSAQCYVCAIPQLFSGITTALIKHCSASPFTYDLGISTQSVDPVIVSYKLYMEDLDGVYEPGADDPLIRTETYIEISNGSDYKTGTTQLPAPFCCYQPFSDYDMFVEVTAQGFPNIIRSQIISTECATLPIKLNFFTATRNQSKVALKWETLTEQNNRGFDVQRKLGTGGWQSIGFVSSKATNGDSQSPLNYELSDINTTAGITQYRLKQVDLDNRASYSEIRSVRGQEQKAKTIVYPNPSNDGKVNIVFEEGSAIRDVSIIDINGRTVKQWKGITNNNILVENLNAGFYSVRVLNTTTGEQVVEKIVVNKR